MYTVSTIPDKKYISGSLKFSFSSSGFFWILTRIFFPKHKENTKYFQELDKKELTAPIPVGKLRISWLGHSTVFLQTADGVNIILDPIAKRSIAGVISRITGIPIPLRDLPHTQVCLISHDHYDHLDTKGLQDISPDIVVAGNGIRSVISKRHSVTELSWWKDTETHGLNITFVPAKHWSKRGLGRKNKNLWGGFVVQTKTHTIYYAGDTAFCDVPALVKERFKNIDLAILPIGGYKPDILTEFHTTPTQSFTFFKILDAKYFLPVHWGTYNLSEESAYDPIERLEKEFAMNDSESGKLLRLPVGGTVII